MAWLRAILLGCLVLTAAGAARAATLDVGPGKQFKQPSEAIAAAKPGDTVSIAPGQYYDCALVRQDNLTIEGAAAGAVLTDTTCAGKAILVISGNDVTIRNLTLQRARVPDHNGAGIRAEGGNLTIENVKFLNNEEGILTADNPNATLRITGSEFIHNGACEGGCAHGIYTGRIKLLRVEHSRFFETQHAHNIKSKALNTEIVDCDIQDGSKGTSSYQIDVPNGGSLLVEGSTLEKGPNSENHSVPDHHRRGGRASGKRLDRDPQQHLRQRTRGIRQRSFATSPPRRRSLWATSSRARCGRWMATVR